MGLFNKQTEHAKNSNFKIDGVYFNDNAETIYMKYKNLTKNGRESLKKYNELASYREVVDDMQENKKHGITRAVTGSLIAGPTGAIVGAATGGKTKKTVEKMKVILMFTDGSSREVNLIMGKLEMKSALYQQRFQKMVELEAKLDSILAAQEQETSEIRSNT